MRHKIFYGGALAYTEADLNDFSRDGYACKALMKDRRGAPVVISQRDDPAFPVWRVVYGFSCVFFATRADAMAFCDGRFTA